MCRAVRLLPGCAVMASVARSARFGAMRTVLVGLAITVIIAFVILLSLLRAGIWQQERAGSLTRRPRGLSAAIARRVFGLHARLPERAADRSAAPGPAGDEPPLAQRRNGSAMSWTRPAS